MISNILKSVFCSLVSKVTKRGFTLAEALIITVMTGACLLPILGTMQNAQVRTENYDHQSKMQLYARSRLTAEIANAAFDHKSIDLEDEYHYIVYFASSATNTPADEDEAKLIELPKTYATLEDMASLTIDPDHNNWATAAIELLGISRNNGAPYLKIVHAYKTSVETQYDIKLATYTLGVDTTGENDYFSSPKGLLAIVVKTCLLESNGQKYHEDDGSLVIDPPITSDDGVTTDRDKSEQVTPVTLFSFANLPIVSDEYIWIADSHNKKVIGIDPESKTLATEIDFSKEGEDGKPLHLAVHPSGKILAVQAKKKVYLVNIDIKSPLKGNKNIVVSSTNDYALEDEGGIAFRTDGKVLYFTDKHNSSLHIYELEYGFNSDNTIKWDNTTPSTLTSKHASINFEDYGDKFSNIVAANDGNIYIGENDSKIIFNYPMYSLIENGKSYHTIHVVKVDKNIKSIDVSNDGKLLLYVPKEHTSNKSLVRIYNTTTGEEIKTIEAAKELSYGIFSSISDKNFSITDGSLFAVLTEKKKEGGNGAGVQVFGLDNKQWFELQNTNIEENGRIIQSPYNSKIIFTSKMKKGKGNGNGHGNGNDKDMTNLYFSDFLYSTAAHNLTDEEAMVLSEEKGIAAVHADLAANKHDIMAVAKENKHIDMYDLNTMKELEDISFVATNSLTGLTMNNQGTMLYSSHSDSAPGCFRYNLSDGSTVNPTINTYRRKTVFDGNSQDMLFSLQYAKDNSGDITNEGFVNLYHSVSDRWETLSNDSYDRRMFTISPEWKGLDLIGMPNGGALVLYGKTDGSSMIEWIGRRDWAQDSTDKKGKYRLFARWTNIYRAPVTESYLPDYSSLTSFNLADSTEGIVNILNSPLNLNSEVRSFDFRAANGSNFNDSSTRYITPILLRKIASNKFKVVNYATNDISTTKGQSQVDVPITWKYEFKINQPETYYLGWWNGHNTTKYKGIIGYDSDSSTSGEILAGWAFVDRLSQLTSTEFETSSYPYKRNYNIKFKITPALSESLAFPPLGSKKLAITPNQSIMAILATDSSDIPYINLYDFNNQLYGPETQIEGMLLDYRKQKQSGVNQGTTTDYTKLENPWPEENIDKPLFEKVEDNCHFGDGINTFGEATTKHDSWTSFNEHPCNYSSTYSENSSNKKGWANKRFIGYIRPETNIDYMQMYFSDEPRIFCNKSFIYGTLERGPLSFLSDALPLSFVSYSSNLFQLDYASNQGNMDLSVFFNTQKKQTMNSVTTTGTAESRYYYIVNNTDKTNGWIPLNSSDTYILNNHPSFMASFEAKINSSTQLNITNTSMVFSRDRAKPVLYITGSTYLWALYKNSLIRAKQTDNGSIKGNLAISTNGQNLLYGTISGGKNLIRVVDIANPDENKFSNTSITTKEESVSAFSNSYLNIIKDLSVDSAPSYLVTKPFNSYSSEEVIGKYELLIATTSFNVSTNAATVASGGIYIVNDASSTILVYNPITGSGTVKIKNDVLKKNAHSVAVTAYDDTIYLFGNAGNGTDDAISGRVQCYDVSSRNSLSSKQRSGDSYRASIYSSAGNTYVVIEGSDNGISDKKNAFMNNSSDWIDDEYSSNISYSYFLGKPFVVNKIYINNDAEWGGSFNVGVKDFRFVGVNGTNEKELCRGSLKNPEATEICFANDTAYQKYKLYCDTTHASLNHVGLKQLTFYRTGLVRLTPKRKTEIYDKSETEKWMKYSNDKVASATIFWSNNSGDAYFYQIYDNLGTSDTAYEAYEGNYSSAQSWQVSSTDVNPYLTISFEEPEIIKFLRYSNGNGYVTSIRLYGNNDNEIPSVSSNPSDNGWIEITNLGSLPNVINYWIPNEISNSNKFKHYLVSFSYSGAFRVHGFEVYGCVNTQDYLTSMKNDNLDEVKAGLSAACATPYGLVITGGRNPEASGTNTCNHAMLYWPHAINKYDGSFTEFGIPRSLPNMNISRMQHSLVWHKGRIYAIGGKDSSNPRAGDSFAEYLDYNSSMVWQQINKEDFKPKGNDTVNLLARYNHGACSFGDEIFIFGGQKGESSKNLKTVYAWNPETGVVRSLKELPEVLSPCSAVVFGSKIYVMGMDGSSPSKFRIYEYTP